jgi:hypothetical protein
MPDLLLLLLVSNHDPQESLVLAEKHLSKRKYDAKASRIAKALRESLRTARRVARMAEAERLRSGSTVNEPRQHCLSPIYGATAVLTCPNEYLRETKTIRLSRNTRRHPRQHRGRFPSRLALLLIRLEEHSGGLPRIHCTRPFLSRPQ